MSFTKINTDNLTKSLLISIVREHYLSSDAEVCYFGGSDASKGYLLIGSSESISRELEKSDHIGADEPSDVVEINGLFSISGRIDGVLLVSMLNVYENSSIEFTNQQMLIRTWVSQPASYNTVQKFLFALGLGGAAFALLATIIGYFKLQSYETLLDLSSVEHKKVTSFYDSIADLERAEKAEEVGQLGTISLTPIKP